VTEDATPTSDRTKLDRWSPCLWLLGGGVLTAATALAPLQGECGFRFLFGAPCPGCGMTRASLALVHGDLRESWRLHPLALPLAAAFLAATAMAIHEGATGRYTFRRIAGRWASPVAIGFLGAFVLVWLLRVVVHPAWSPDPLRPGSLAARLLG